MKKFNLKKCFIFAFNGHKFIVNFLIIFMLVLTSLFASYGINFAETSTMYNGVFYRGDEKEQNVSLMINVYWGTEYIDEMLQVLKENNITTTFFVGGTWAVKESGMLEKIFNQGHEIGNHGYYHKDQGKLSRHKNREEILNTHNLVKSLIGIDMSLFAPPSGSYNSKTVDVATELGYKTIMWSEKCDTIDWRDKDENLIFKRATQNPKNGNFILMHPTLATKNALPKIIKFYVDAGFKICSVSENLGMSAS